MLKRLGLFCAWFFGILALLTITAYIEVINGQPDNAGEGIKQWLTAYIMAIGIDLLIAMLLVVLYILITRTYGYIRYDDWNH